MSKSSQASTGPMVHSDVDKPELPTELWLDIATRVAEIDQQYYTFSSSLFSLSQTCHELYSICMPIIREQLRRQFKESALLTSTTYQNISHLIIRLSHVHNFSELRCVRYGIRERDEDGSNFDSIEVQTESRQVSAPLLAALLRTCAQHTEALNVRELVPPGERGEDYPFEIVFPTPVVDHDADVGIRQSQGSIASSVRWFEPTLQLLSKWVAVITRRPQNSVVPPNDNGITIVHGVQQEIRRRPPRYTITPQSDNLTVTRFELISTELFSASMYPWTEQFLNSSPIRRLSIHVRLSIFHYAQILPSLHMPLLEELEISDIQLAFPDLKAFLSRHPTLKALELSYSNPIGPVELDQDNAFLTNLSTLQAGPEYILPFLNHHLLGYLPELRTYDLYPWKSYPYPVSPDSERQQRRQLFGPIFDCIERGDQSPELHLRLWALPLTSLIEWFVSSPPGSDARCLRGVNKITVAETCVLVPTSALQELIARAQQHKSFLEMLDPLDLSQMALTGTRKAPIISQFLLFVCPNLQPAELHLN